jgi:integrase
MMRPRFLTADVFVSALLTGCRYHELGTLRPMDVNLDVSVITVRSKSGQRSVVLTEEPQRLFHQLTAGKADRILLFTRAQWRGMGQKPPIPATEELRVRPQRRLSHSTVFATLTVLASQWPALMRVIGHSSVKITERHYAHLSPGYVAGTIRAA